MVNLDWSVQNGLTHLPGTLTGLDGRLGSAGPRSVRVSPYILSSRVIGLPTWQLRKPRNRGGSDTCY